MSKRLPELEEKNRGKKGEFGARELPQWVRVLAILAEDRGLVPKHSRDYDNHLKLQLQVTQLPLLTSRGITLSWCSYIYTSKTLIHTKYKIKSLRKHKNS